VWEIGPDVREAVPVDAALERQAAALALGEVGAPGLAEARAEPPLRVGFLDGPPGTLSPLQGTSHGLPLVLAHASRLLGVALPGDVAATGAITWSGAVSPVEGVANKGRTLRALAPGVRRFLVPAGGDLPEVEGLTLVPVAQVSEAVEAMFPDWEAALERGWSDPPTVARDAAELLRLAGSTFGLRSWRGVERRRGRWPGPRRSQCRGRTRTSRRNSPSGTSTWTRSRRPGRASC
jgi:hypothetical protein